jgi:hypothetical protein
MWVLDVNNGVRLTRLEPLPYIATIRGVRVNRQIVAVIVYYCLAGGGQSVTSRKLEGVIAMTDSQRVDTALDQFGSAVDDEVTTRLSDGDVDDRLKEISG